MINFDLIRTRVSDIEKALSFIDSSIMFEFVETFHLCSMKHKKVPLEQLLMPASLKKMLMMSSASRLWEAAYVEGCKLDFL